jgi:hypothetical protein
MIRDRNGTAVLEVSLVVVGLAVVTVTLFGALRAHWSATKAEHELTAARAAIAAKAAELEAAPFRTLFARFNGLPHDDPEGPFTAPGSWFEAPGLEPVGPRAGRIEFPVDGVGQLRETLSIAWAVMPRDLNADRVIDPGDRSNDYTLLPVRLVVEWRGVLGVRRAEQVLFLRSR